MNLFKIDDTFSIVCESKSTRYGFKHTATIMQGNNELISAKICYINRTWERYTYESVISKILHKSKLFTDSECRKLLEKFNPYKS